MGMRLHGNEAVTWEWRYGGMLQWHGNETGYLPSVVVSLISVSPMYFLSSALLLEPLSPTMRILSR